MVGEEDRNSAGRGDLTAACEHLLHYVFDLWVEAWRKKVAKGDCIVVRYADDLVVGFESRAEADDS
jgi:hypothetical protein